MSHSVFLHIWLTIQCYEPYGFCTECTIHANHRMFESLCIVTAADFKPFTKLHSSQLLTERTNSRQYETAAKNKLEFYRAEWEAGGDNEVE